MGWSLGIPNIQRKTEKELPQYRDEEDSDTFIFSGAEDLVREMKEENGEWKLVLIERDGLTIKRYRPRIEGLFARIEKIEANGNVYWKVTSKDNVVSVFGETIDARIADPSDPTRIFRWNIEYSYDDKGHFTRYHYKREDDAGIATTVSEKNRINNLAQYTNLYLKKVWYGNKTAFYPGNTLPRDQRNFLFELELDYGEYDDAKFKSLSIGDSMPDPTRAWTARQDPFSSYRSGFEIRTYRRCQRILMYHRFGASQLKPNPYLVRSLDLQYDPTDTHFSFLKSITQVGYIWTEGGNLRKDGKQSHPPMSFKYADHLFNREVKTISPEDLNSAPVGLADTHHQWVDLYSEGLSGILTEQGDGWYYKSNLGSGQFSPPTLVSPKPSYTGLSDNRLSLQDLEGNGTKQLVQPGRHGGYFELDACDGWKSFQPFEQMPNINLQDPNLKMIDLDGDGLPDLLLSMESEFLWYPSLGKGGYDDYRVAGKHCKEELAPQVLFSDSHAGLLIATADMSGDGLSDIVLIQNSSVAYYPNLGYGRFGVRVTMSMSGSFDHEDQFNTQYLHLADIDGSGTTDLIYAGKNKIQVRYNESGNSISLVDEFYNPFPRIDNQSKIAVLDLLGTGTSCIVWSSALPGDRSAPMRYIDLTQGQKPHVMTEYWNNMGKVVQVSYKPSTYYYLEDKKMGNPWITKLAFPVQCVHKVKTADRVSQVEFTSEYTYHHGYYDGVEREFRGFAMVEQRDTETFEHWEGKEDNSNNVTVTRTDINQAAVITKSWFHTGYYHCRDRYTHLLQEEYYPGAVDEAGHASTSYILPDYPIPTDLAANEISECYRALKGLPLRQEVYSEEGSLEKQKHPYTITQFNYNIQRLQQKAGAKHAVFLSTEKEKLSFVLERNPHDPRVSQNINIEIDAFGNILESAAIVYGRFASGSDTPIPLDLSTQQQRHIIYTVNRFTNGFLEEADVYRLPLPCETKTLELKAGDPAETWYTSAELGNAFHVATARKYLERIQVAEKRLIEHVAILYKSDDLSRALPHGVVDKRALPYEQYQLAFTEDMVPTLYGAKADDAILRNEGKYVRFGGDNNYWIRSGLMHYHPDHNLDLLFVPTPSTADLNYAKKNFFLPMVYEDPAGSITLLKYDEAQLYIQKIRDAVENVVEVSSFNYRTLAPDMVKDPNGNRTAVRLNALGLPTALFVMGNKGDGLGDSRYDSNEAHGRDRPSVKMDYDWHAYIQSNPDNLPPNDVSYPDIQANAIQTISFWEHASNDESESQMKYSYSDGSGNVVLEKVQAEKGNVIKMVAGQKKELKNVERWIGSGRTILNNKGNPVKQYEPFFDDNAAYTTEEALVCQGYSPTMYYDALNRPIKTENPDGTFTHVVFDAWSQTHFDENDNILYLDENGDEQESSWYQERTAPSIHYTNPIRVAAKQTEIHKRTPTRAYLDSLGRVFLTVEHNRWARSQDVGPDIISEDFILTRIDYDIGSNPTSVMDDRQNTVMQWKYDMLGHQVFQRSMDGGDTWMLPDALQREIRRWDSRQHLIATAYDALSRPVSQKLYTPSDHKTVERYIYGESLPAGVPDHNHRGQLYALYDTAGRTRLLTYDFKGNALSSDRTLLADHKVSPNYVRGVEDSLLLPEEFASAIKYDALNRVKLKTTPDDSVQELAYNHAGLLNRIKCKIRGGSNARVVIDQIKYNARGQRESIRYGNGTTTKYTYDPQTYRLLKLRTTGNPPDQSNGNEVYQHLEYTYDPVGNITRMHDQSQKDIFFRGQKIQPINTYTYDSKYQLISASGREHKGQISNGPSDNWDDNWCLMKYASGDRMAFQNYTQKYNYDSVGNILEMKHVSASNAWTKTYIYQNHNNQLKSTIVGNGSTHNYDYDNNVHGSMINMPQLSDIQWNFREEVQYLETYNGREAWYQYDTEGERNRKEVTLIDSSGNSSGTYERLYLDGLEIYREKDYNGNIRLERSSLHIQDDMGRVCIIDSLAPSGGAVLTESSVRYQYANHLGSVTIELDKKRYCLSYEEYHPYGTSAYRAILENSGLAEKQYRYTGMERDEESGMSYHSARYYLPWLGRWLSEDPIGVEGGQNVYKYSNNNPINGRDHTGLYCDSNTASCDTTNIEEVEHASLPKNDRYTNASWVDVAQQSTPKTKQETFVARSQVNTADPQNPNNFPSYESYRQANLDQAEAAVRQEWLESKEFNGGEVVELPPLVIIAQEPKKTEGEKALETWRNMTQPVERFFSSIDQRTGLPIKDKASDFFMDATGATRMGESIDIYHEEGLNAYLYDQISIAHHEIFSSHFNNTRHRRPKSVKLKVRKTPDVRYPKIAPEVKVPEVRYPKIAPEVKVPEVRYYR